MEWVTARYLCLAVMLRVPVGAQVPLELEPRHHLEFANESLRVIGFPGSKYRETGLFLCFQHSPGQYGPAKPNGVWLGSRVFLRFSPFSRVHASRKLTAPGV